MIRRYRYLLWFFSIAITMATPRISIASDLKVHEARTLAEEAYVYGFGIVENYKAIFGMCIHEKSPQYSGFNSYLHARKLFDPDYKVVVSANNDTLYSTTWADLRTEPLVISVPPTGKRYFSIQLVDMFTDNFAYIGTRETGPDGGVFVLVGPTYKGSLPADKFRQMGNAAGTGAKLALISMQKRNEAQVIASRVDYVELASAPNFSEVFVRSSYLGE